MDYFYYLCIKNRENMTLKELETRLEAIQESQMVTYSSLEKAGIGYMTAKRIQNGDNYQVKMLFKYVDLLCQYVIVNGQVMEDVEKLGEYLFSLRQAAGLTTIQIASKMVVAVNTVLAIEKGTGYKRESLLKYIEAIGGVDFEIDDIINRIST